jgi:hypothetical protein
MTDSVADVIRSGVPSGLDFVGLDELRKHTGVSDTDDVPKFALSEMLANALDKEDAAEIRLDVSPLNGFVRVIVSDNGSKGLSKADLERLLRFGEKPSSKRGLHMVSRGYLGNALQCVFGFTFALAEAANLPPRPIAVISGPTTFLVKLEVDRVGGTIRPRIREEERAPPHHFTAISVQFPRSGRADDEGLDSYARDVLDLVAATSMVNPGRRIDYSIFGRRGAFGDRRSKEK